MKKLGCIEIGSLVDINPVFFGYDNIRSQWHSKLFIVVEIVLSPKMTAADEPYIICRVLMPDNSLYDFYDYELRIVQ